MWPLLLFLLSCRVASGDIRDVFLQMQLPNFSLRASPNELEDVDRMEDGDGSGGVCSFESIAGVPVHFVHGKVRPILTEQINVPKPTEIASQEYGKWSLLLNDICALSCFDNPACVSAQRSNETCAHFDVRFSQFVPRGAVFMQSMYMSDIRCMAQAKPGEAKELLGCSFRKLEGRPKADSAAAVDEWMDGFLLVNLTWVRGGWERQECARRCATESRCVSAHVYRSQCELFDRDFRLTHTTASIGTTLRDIRCPNLVPEKGKG